MSFGLFFKPLPVHEVAAKLVEVAGLAFANELTTFSVTSSIAGFQTEFTTPAAQIAAHGNFVTFMNAVKNRPHLMCVNASIRTNANVAVNFSLQDPLTSKVELAGMAPDRAATVLDLLEARFNIVPYSDLVASRDPFVNAAIQARERSVTDLNEATSKLATYLADMAVRDAEHRRKLQEELDENYRQRQEALDAEQKRREEALTARVERQAAEQEAKEADFRTRQEQFDTKESKFRRRALLERIETLLKENETYKISEKTAEKRIIVHGAVSVLLVVSGSVLGSFLYRLVFKDVEPSWHLLLPLGASSATFVTTMVYYLKWNDRWFREHADNEMAAKRYKADILRASWVAELVSEWKSEGHRTPRELVEAFTRGLFRDVGASQESEHPLDGLTGMLKRANSFRLGKDGFAVRALSPKPKTRKSRGQEGE